MHVCDTGRWIPFLISVARLASDSYNRKALSRKMNITDIQTDGHLIGRCIDPGWLLMRCEWPTALGFSSGVIAGKWITYLFYYSATAQHNMIAFPRQPHQVYEICPKSTRWFDCALTKQPIWTVFNFIHFKGWLPHFRANCTTVQRPVCSIRHY